MTSKKVLSLYELCDHKSTWWANVEKVITQTKYNLPTHKDRGWLGYLITDSNIIFNYAWFARLGATQTSHWCSVWHGDYLWPCFFKLCILLLQTKLVCQCVSWLCLKRCDEFEDKGKSRSSEDGTFTSSAFWEFAELCARCLLSFLGKILDDRRFHCFPNIPDFSDKWALEIVEILPLSRRQIKKIGNVSIFPMPSQIFTMMAIINLVHGVWKLRFSRSRKSVIALPPYQSSSCLATVPLSHNWKWCAQLSQWDRRLSIHRYIGKIRERREQWNRRSFYFDDMGKPVLSGLKL